MTSVAMPLLGPMGQSRNSPPSPARRSSTQTQLANLQQDKTIPRSQTFSANRGHSPTNARQARQTSNSRSPRAAPTLHGEHVPLNSESTSAEKAIKTEAPTSPATRDNPRPNAPAPAPAAAEARAEGVRPRPKRLDLSSGGRAPRGPQTAGNLGSREGLAIKDLGVACLSPGFQTQDPTMREQLQRSLSVREQQRQLIEARQKGGSAKSVNAQDGAEAQRYGEASRFARSSEFDKDPLNARRKGPPAGLSINAPTPASFANERVIQSAPLNHSFTGLRRNTTYQPSSLGQTSHIHQVNPAPQTGNRLPPLSDVFSDRIESPKTASGQFRPSYPHPQQTAAVRSPGIPPQQQKPAAVTGPQPTSSRSREFRSAEEAMQCMAGGREEHLPKMVHYGGVQPPTPPSPMQGGQASQPQSAHSVSAGQYHDSRAAPPHGGYRTDYSRSGSGPGRRRTREEFERENGGSPATQQGPFKRHAQEGGDWRAEMGSREKRDEFLRLCERAWDLFHS